MSNEADKRSVHTDALATLGTIIGAGEKRDAIHLAVEPVIAGHDLMPGNHVTIKGGVAVNATVGQGLGIVDPFISGLIEKGERFWLVVYPRQITSLRHVWEHPSFPASGETDVVSKPRDRETSEQWLRNFVATSDCPNYETLIAGAISPSHTWDDEYLHFNDVDAHGEIPPEFWDHVEVVTGVTIPADRRAKYFSCYC